MEKIKNVFEMNINALEVSSTNHYLRTVRII